VRRGATGETVALGFEPLDRPTGGSGFRTSLKPAGPQTQSKPSTTVRPAAAPAAEDPTVERDRVARARMGDEDAFRQLVERHRDRAYGLALRILRSSPDAEEVAQDAFVRAWRGLAGFRGDARFGTWLYRIVARQALDRAAMLRARRERETGLDEASGVAAAAPEAGARVDATGIEPLLARLSDAQRVVVTMFYLEDRSVEQVAASLRMPENTVKTHLSRARAALRRACLATQEELA
jgi:RNA polymerase sigma-70 factor (ECF subfamily)